MTMYMALHPRDDVDRLYASRKGGRIGLANIENSIDASIQLKENIKKEEKDWLQPETILTRGSTEQK